MKHTFVHTLLCAIMAASTAVFINEAPGVQAAAAATAAGGRYCYAWDFINTSGGDATGLRLTLAGVSQIDAVYGGAANPFGAADATSGFNAATNSYALNFSSGTAFSGDTIQTGLCTASASLSLSSASWTASGQTVGDPPRYLGIHFNWQTPGHLRVELTNPLAVTATLSALNVLQPEQPLSLDDLNATVAAQLPLVTEAISVPVDLPPQGMYAIDLLFSPTEQRTVDQALVVDASLSPQDNPDNSVHLVAQTLGQVRKVNLPLTVR